MSGNRVKRSVHPLVWQVNGLLKGLARYERSLSVSIYPAAVIEPLLDALLQKNTAYRAACEAEKTARAELHRAADAARAFVPVLASVFRPVLGWTWNRSWEQLGFLGGSLAVPGTYSALLGILRATESYLTSHPAAEVPMRGVPQAEVNSLFDATITKPQ